MVVVTPDEAVPTPTFTMSPPVGIAPVTVTLDARGSTGGEDDPIAEYRWRFGDGTTDTGRVVERRVTEAGALEVALTIVTSSGDTATASSTGSYRTLDSLDVPICGDQDDGTEVLRCDEYEWARDVQVWNVAGDGSVPVTFDWVYRNAGNDNQLSAYVVDDDQGTVDGVAPGEDGYAAKALARARTVFANGADASTPDVTLPFEGGDRLAFYISTASNEFLADFGGLESRMLFSIGAANEDLIPHALAFDRPGGPTEFSFEDLQGGGDGDFDDVVFTANGISTKPNAAPVAADRSVTTDAGSPVAT